ncbi:MAG: hypothetical protein CV088_08195, partial [Nitrospira sp. LK70]|nr:hypothetical protein [Nitrospira sp. LK70]
MLNLLIIPKGVAMGLIVLILSACHHMVLTKVHKKDKSPPGLTYYLPKKLVKVTVTRKPVSSDRMKALSKAVEESKAGSEKAKKEFESADEAAKFADKVVTKLNAASDTDAKAIAIRKAAQLKAEANTLKDRLKEAEEKAQRTLELYEAAIAEEAGTREIVDQLSEARQARADENRAEGALAQADAKLQKDPTNSVLQAERRRAGAALVEAKNKRVAAVQKVQREVTPVFWTGREAKIVVERPSQKSGGTDGAETKDAWGGVQSTSGRGGN